MVTKVYSLGHLGLNTFRIDIEIDCFKGMPGFEIVGLPDLAVKESRDRVRSALKNCGYDFPISHITVNLAPADIRKIGALYDLPILVSLLKVTGQITADLDNCCFIGELSLNGDVRPVNGVLPMVIKAKEEGFKAVFLPKENEIEGGVIDGISIYGIEHAKQLVDFLNRKITLTPYKTDLNDKEPFIFEPDFAEVKGQQNARRALEIAASGGHNCLLIGPPGSGKSMLAKRVPSILPDMTLDESIETTKIHSVAGTLSPKHPLITTRPFRAPHHTISSAGLSGGGTIPRPGEISLAHNGVLFLDELPEFNRTTMEVMRQPIEDGVITIARASGTLSYPCSMILIAAMNPCPCGYFGHPTRPCSCSPGAVAKYLAKVSGPLLDRLDLHIEAMPVEFDHLSSSEKSESSAQIKARVNAARDIQNERFKGTNITCNARITSDKLHELCPITDDAKLVLKNAFDNLGLSARAYDRILKVARTIADLDSSEVITAQHIAEAVGYRSLDRKYWQR